MASPSAGFEHRELFRLQQISRVPNIIFKDLRGKLDFGLCLGEELSHFQRQELCVGVAVTAQDIGGLLENAAARLGACSRHRTGDERRMVGPMDQLEGARRKLQPFQPGCSASFRLYRPGLGPDNIIDF